MVAENIRSEGQSIGFVHSMGALHEGHLTRVREARRMSDVVVVSIFANPRQSLSGEEFEQVPLDLARDADHLTPIGVDYVFAPSVEEIYPPGFSSYVGVSGLGEKLEGLAAPDHFSGAATAYTILFNLIRPKFAFLGQLDAQQTVILKRVVRDLHIPVEVVVVPIVRESDGLACSSRNASLAAEERGAALVLPRSLRLAEELFLDGERSSSKLLRQMRREIDREPLVRLDYLAITDTERLEPLDDITERCALVSLAAWVGSVRLIDNILLNDEKYKSRTGRLRLG